MSSDGTPLAVAGSSAAEFGRLEHVTVGTLYMVFGIGGVSTNLLLLLTLLKDKMLLRGTSWLHISLALANIGVVAPAPFPASSSFSGKWLYGDKMCQAYAFEGMFVGMAAIGCVVCLCIERYVVRARKEAMQQNASGFYYVCTVLNIGNAVFWATMPLLGWSRYAKDHTGTTCAIDWKNPDEGYTSYMLTLCVFSFGIPVLTALLSLYFSVPSARVASASSQQAASTSGQDSTTSSFTEGQLRWLCLTFLVLVLIGWGPFAWLCVWAMIGDTTGVSMLAAVIPPLSCKFMTMAYPLAYSVASPRFRAGFLSFFGVGVGEETPKAE